MSARKPIQYSLNKALHTKEVQLSQEWFVTTTWPPFHACDTNMADVISCEMLDIRAIFVWPWNENARTKQKQQTNGNSLIDWFIERTQTRVAFGWLSECSGEKNFMPENFLEIIRYFTLTSYCNTIGQSNNAFSILGFSLAGKPCFDLFIHWLMKQTAEHLPKPFFKVIRKSLYMKDTLRNNESRHTICLGKGNKSVCERYLITKLQN